MGGVFLQARLGAMILLRLSTLLRGAARSVGGPSGSWILAKMLGPGPSGGGTKAARKTRRGTGAHARVIGRGTGRWSKAQRGEGRWA